MKYIVVVQSLSCVRLFVTPWAAPGQGFCPLTPGACSNSCSSSQWCHPAILSSVITFTSCPQPFPALGSFPMNQLFTSGGQSIGASASASVLPMSIQSWFPLRLTDLISSQSKGHLRVFSSTVIRKYNSWTLSLSYGPNLTSTHDYWKNHSLNYTDFCLQSDVSAF